MEELRKIRDNILFRYSNIHGKESIIKKSVIVTCILIVFSLVIQSILLEFTILLASTCCLSLYYLQYLYEYAKNGYAYQDDVYLWSVFSFVWAIIVLMSF